MRSYMHPVTYAGGDGHPLVAFSTHPLNADALKRIPTLVLMHGGGPDHRSLVPLATRLRDEAVVVLPDVRGYGNSHCADPARHTWTQYAEDVVALQELLGVSRAVIGGAGLGATISLRVATSHPNRVSGLVLISVEDIEDDVRKADEIVFMDAFAERVRTQGMHAGWAPILGDLSPLIGAMVREAIDDADPASAAAAAAIGRDRAFRSIEDLVGIRIPTLLFAGSDWRHPAKLATVLRERLPNARLGIASMSDDLQTTEDFARAFAPEILAFARELRASNYA